MLDCSISTYFCCKILAEAKKPQKAICLPLRMLVFAFEIEILANRCHSFLMLTGVEAEDLE